MLQIRVDAFKILPKIGIIIVIVIQGIIKMDQSVHNALPIVRDVTARPIVMNVMEPIEILQMFVNV